MSGTSEVYVPAYRDEEGREGIFSRFKPGTRTLPAGFQAKPCFMPLPVDIVLEKDVAVTLRDGVTIYVDVLRPVGVEKAPVIVAWSPYGKSRGNAPPMAASLNVVALPTEGNRRLGRGRRGGSRVREGFARQAGPILGRLEGARPCAVAMQRGGAWRRVPIKDDRERDDLAFILASR